MLSYEIAQESLIFKWDDDESITGQRYRTIKFSSYIAAPALVAFAEAIVAICNRQAIVSSTSCIYAGRFIFEHIARQKKEFPPNRDGWDNFLLTHYECHLRFTDTRLENRVKVWTAITAIYRRLQRKGFIPDDAYIPNESSSIGLLDESLEQPLGHEIVNVTPPKSFDYLLPKKYLVESGLSMADDEYLLGLKRTLELRASTILSCCTDYWDRMLSCHEKGKEIYSAISNQRVEDILNSGKYYVDGYHLGDLETPNGIFWFLAVARHYITKTEKLKTTSMVNLCRLPFYQGILSKERKKNLFSKKIISLAEDSKTQPLQFSEALSRLLGLLSPRDCAVACAILASENPRFNPTSLTNVRLYSKNGTFYLRGNSDTKRITLSVSKPRARSRKESVLPPLSAKIVTDVINCTQTARSHLISERKSGWRKLFLTSTRRKLGRYASFITALNTARGLTLIHMYKAEFEKIGISSDLLTLFRIRCTQGILEFLRNGSIQRVADLLGNTFAVVERCYIPRWLKYRWGTRLLRVLQQKIILVAT
ncbi:TPA: hypothetical protein R8F97_005837, partial [Pseudomonas putida]|nr:hypothetical protein [Pseudomonas putida]